MTKTEFQVTGMTCAHCEHPVSQEVGQLPACRTSRSDRAGRWIDMELIGWLVVVPLGYLAFLTGLVTPRHLVGTRPALLGAARPRPRPDLPRLGVLLLNLPSVTAAATVARDADDVAVLQVAGTSPALGLLVLVVVAVLN